MFNICFISFLTSFWPPFNICSNAMEKNWDQKIRLSLEKNPNPQHLAQNGPHPKSDKEISYPTVTKWWDFGWFWWIPAVQSHPNKRKIVAPIHSWRAVTLVADGYFHLWCFKELWLLSFQPCEGFLFFFPREDLFWGFQVWWKFLGKCPSYDEGITLHTGSLVEAMTLGRKLVMGSCWWAKTATTIAPVFPWYAFLCSLTVPNFPRHAEVEWSTWV